MKARRIRSPRATISRAVGVGEVVRGWMARVRSPFQGSTLCGMGSVGIAVSRALPFATIVCTFGAPIRSATMIDDTGEHPQMTFGAPILSATMIDGTGEHPQMAFGAPILSAKGAAYRSPGQRPGLAMPRKPEALKGRPNACGLLFGNVRISANGAPYRSEGQRPGLKGRPNACGLLFGNVRISANGAPYRSEGQRPGLKG